MIRSLLRTRRYAGCQDFLVGDQTRILLVRHAHHDSRGRFTQHSCRGLTYLGLQQARALAERLALTEFPLQPVVMSSQARRCIQTAEIVAERLGVPLSGVTCDLCEMHPGAAEGLTFEEMRDQFGPNYGFVPGGEYFPDWLPQAVERLLALLARHEGRTFIGITHFAVIKAALVAFSDWATADLDVIAPGNTAITEWRSQPVATDSGSGLTLCQVTDASHL